MFRPTRRALLAAPALLPGLAAAQSFPARSITWIVPFAAGGITDTSARTLAQRMAGSLGQTVVVENRPGAGGTIGAEAVARAAPDGYTMLYGSQGPMAAAPAMFPGLRYDPQRDLAPVHGLGASPHLIVTGADRPWRSLQELVAAAAGAAGRADLCLGRRRHLAAPGGRDAAAGDRHPHGPCALCQRHPGAERRHRRPAGRDVGLPADQPRACPRRPAAGAWR